jgi:hypothetical protein
MMDLLPNWHFKLLRIIFSAENMVIEIWVPAISAVFGIVSVIFTVYVSNI